MKSIKSLGALLLGALSAAPAMAQQPKEGADVHADGDVLAIVTIVTER